MADSPEITRTPPLESEFVWIREDRILPLLQETLNEVVAQRGNKAKALAWDVRVGFKRRLSA